MNTDPLLDSDDEAYADENTRLDYGQCISAPVLYANSPSLLLLTVLRLRIISRLRGKDPTPPRELGPYSVNPPNQPFVAYGAR